LPLADREKLDALTKRTDVGPCRLARRFIETFLRRAEAIHIVPRTRSKGGCSKLTLQLWARDFDALARIGRPLGLQPSVVAREILSHTIRGSDLSQTTSRMPPSLVGTRQWQTASKRVRFTIRVARSVREKLNTLANADVGASTIARRAIETFLRAPKALALRRAKFPYKHDTSPLTFQLYSCDLDELRRLGEEHGLGCRAFGRLVVSLAFQGEDAAQMLGG
jgi:hypothetical protein